MTLNVRLPREALDRYSASYAYGTKGLPDPWLAGDHPEFLTVESFLRIGIWKSPRSERHLRNNDVIDVQEVTRLALAQESDRMAVHILMALNGVGMPMASAILHWTHRKPFPILDFRALWSLGIEMPSDYTLSFWENYVSLSRELAATWGCDMRTLDRALWQYSKENQSPTSPTP